MLILSPCTATRHQLSSPHEFANQEDEDIYTLNQDIEEICDLGDAKVIANSFASIV